jgi:hypothetical protein
MLRRGKKKKSTDIRRKKLTDLPKLTKNYRYVHNCLTFFSSHHDQERKKKSINKRREKNLTNLLNLTEIYSCVHKHLLHALGLSSPKKKVRKKNYSKDINIKWGKNSLMEPSRFSSTCLMTAARPSRISSSETFHVLGATPHA